MKFQILISGVNKKDLFNLSSAELAKRVVKVKAPNKFAVYYSLIFFVSFCIRLHKSTNKLMWIYISILLIS